MINTILEGKGRGEKGWERKKRKGKDLDDLHHPILKLNTKRTTIVCLQSKNGNTDQWN